MLSNLLKFNTLYYTEIVKHLNSKVLQKLIKQIDKVIETIDTNVINITYEDIINKKFEVSQNTTLRQKCYYEVEQLEVIIDIFLDNLKISIIENKLKFIQSDIIDALKLHKIEVMLNDAKTLQQKYEEFKLKFDYDISFDFCKERKDIINTYELQIIGLRKKLRELKKFKKHLLNQ